MKEREIDLIDLFVEILLHWRLFIVWMLIGAILSGAYSFAHSRNDIKVQQAQTLAPEEWLSEEEMQNVNYAVAYEKIYQEKLAYLEKSPLMSIDSTHVSKAEATIVISAEDAEKNYDIKKIYENILQSGELITYVSENTGIETAGLDEIILLAPDSVISDITTASSNTLNVTVNEAKINPFRIIVKYDDKEQCQNILNTIITFLKDKQPVIENTFGEYEFIIIDSSFGIVSDEEIADKQRIALDDIRVMKKTISDLKTAFTDSEQQYYTLLMSNGGINQEQASSTEALSSSGINKKYVLLGAIIVAFLYALWLFFIYIFNTQIRYTDNLQELCDIPQLGLIPAPENNKKVFSFIDKWLLSLRNHGKRQFTQEEALDLASVAIKISAGKEALAEISLVGCGLKEHSLDTCEKIKTQLAKDNIQINILNNVLYNAQAMNELEYTKGVVLVESIGSTLYNELVEELELLKRQEIKILGGVLVG